MNDVHSPDPASIEVARTRRIATIGAVLAALVSAVAVGLPLMGEAAIQPPLSAVNTLLLALVHLADAPDSILRFSRKTRVLLTGIVLTAATFAGMWLTFHWPFNICILLWPLPTTLEPTPACVGAVWLIGASRLCAERPKWTRLSAILAVAALPPALVSLVGWVFGPTLVATVVTPLHLRVSAALTILALVCARLSSPLQAMPFRWLLGDGPTAVWIRRGVLSVLILTPALMLLHDHAVDAHWYDTHAAAMISTVLMLAIGLTGTLWTAGKLHNAELSLRTSQIELEHRVADRTHELALANQALSRDIAERRRMDDQLRASRERLKAVTDSAIDPIMTVDVRGKIVQWNYAATRVFHYPESAILGAPLELLLPELRPEGMNTDDFAARIAMWLGQTRRCVGHCSGGAKIDLEVSLAMWQDRDNRFYSIIGRDVTERTRTEQELLEAKDAAESANRSKSQFLANMSHEIRTPMNVILGMAELIGVTELSDDQRRYVRSTREAGDHLMEIINDILDLSKVEAGAMKLDAIEFDVRELADQVIDFLAPRAYSKQLELVCRLDPTLPPTVIGDPQRLRQVLVNLLGNAVKFTDNGHVELCVDVAGPDRLHVAIQDTGCGIPETMQQAIFESFTQVDASSTRRHGGTGLGLAISRQLVSLMSGQIRVESQVNRGSTFHVDLPLPFCREERESTGQEATDFLDKVKHCRVVVAGGQSVFRQALARQLAEIGATVTDIARFSALLPQLRAADDAGQPWDVLILDQDMGELDGYAAALCVSQAGLSQPPRMALATPNENAGDVSRRNEAGIQVMLRKPVRQRALLEGISRLLGMRKPSQPALAEQVTILAATSRALLVVDDASDNLRLMEAFLRDTGWHVETADDGARAVAKWREGQFDAILMDLQMPVMDGLAATREIRRQEVEVGRRATPIIAVSAHALDVAREESLQAGCTAFLAKPLRRARLLDVLTDLFAGAEPNDGAPDGPIDVTVDPLLLTLIPGFLEHRREDVGSIEKALTSGDFSAIRLLGHSMKGSGGSYGFDGISRIGRALEMAARDKDMSSVRSALGALDDYLQRVRVQ